MLHLLSSAYLVDTLEPIVKWITIGILGALLIIGAILFFAKKDYFSKFIKGASIGFIFYALVLGIAMLIMEITKKYDTAYLEENWVSLEVIGKVFVPVLITLSLSLIAGVILFFLAKKKSSAFKTVAIVLGALIVISLVVTLIMIGVYYSQNIIGDGYYTDEEYGDLNPTALYIFAGIMVLATVSIALFLGRKDKKPFDTHCIALAGICASLSFALSYIKLWDMPTGGSVTLVSLLPVMLFAYVYGTKKGLLVGFLYGMLQAIQDPWLIHPAQFLLDYPIAFSMVCFAGVLKDLNLFSNSPRIKFTLSALLAGALRFLCHVLSGVFAFGAYAVDAGATNFWTYSLIYNSYVFIDVALVIIAGLILFSSKGFNREIEKLNPDCFNKQDIA